MKREGPHRQRSALVTWPRPSARAPAATLCAAPWSAAVPTMPPPQPLRTSSSPTSSLGWGQAPGSVGEGRPSARQAGACWTAAPLCVGGPRPPVRGRCVPSLSLVLPLSVSFPSRAQPPSWDTQAHPQVSHGCPSHRCPPRGPAARALMHTCQRWNRRSTQEPGPLTPAAGSRPDPEQELP